MSFVWNVRPEVFSFSPLPRWYGLIFASGFAGGFFMVKRMFERDGKGADLLDSLLTYIVLGTVIGMRLGHCLLYQPEIYLRDPIRILKIWEGGFASHGGFLGVIIALVLFARKHGMTFAWLADRVSVASMFGAGAIRVGNFFNSEMVGPPTDQPWGVIFAQIDSVPRHPAQLYEAFGYFTISFVGYWLYKNTRITARQGRLLGVTMIAGFGWRFICEFLKEDQVAFEADMLLNMGQLLSLPFIVLGILFALGLWDKLTGGGGSDGKSGQGRHAEA
jgi:prolipoprotein diacylglyceryl transferase